MIRSYEEGNIIEPGLNVYAWSQRKRSIGFKLLLGKSDIKRLLTFRISRPQKYIVLDYKKYREYTVEVDPEDDMEVFLGPNRFYTIVDKHLIIPYWFRGKE